MAPHLVNRYDKINTTVTAFFSSAESAPKMYLLKKINTCNKVGKHNKSEMETLININSLRQQNNTRSSASFFKQWTWLQRNYGGDSTMVAWAQPLLGSRWSSWQPKRLSECRFPAPPPASIGNTAKNVRSRPQRLSRQHCTRHCCKEVWTPSTKQRFFWKKLKTSSNNHVYPSQLHHRREHCQLFAGWRHCYAQLLQKKERFTSGMFKEMF